MTTVPAPTGVLPRWRRPLVVVAQTLVELVVMVVFVRLIPRLIPADHRAKSDNQIYWAHEDH